MMTMETLDTWMADRGTPVAGLINSHIDTICDHVSSRLANTFPTLCLDPLRIDSVNFQKHTFRETPRRLHRLIQVVLLCNSTAVVEREYRWGWRLLTRFNVERRHLLAHARWYFEEVLATVPLTSIDQQAIMELRDHVVQMIEAETVTTFQFIDQARRRQRLNGFGSNGHK